MTNPTDIIDLIQYLADCLTSHTYAEHFIRTASITARIAGSTLYAMLKGH
jgi:hypothetical protein